jgi:hypothetical protein
MSSSIWQTIDGLSFVQQKAKMARPEYEGWSIQKLDTVELFYKRMLYLWLKHPESKLPPSQDIDIFWHYHILDTRKYHDDCHLVFGRYHHHYPYFGIEYDGQLAVLDMSF